MRRASIAVAIVVSLAWLLTAGLTRARAQGAGRVQWIWHNGPDPAKGPPPGTRYFRRAVDIMGLIEPPVDDAALDVGATAPFTVWLNGVKVLEGSDPRRIFTADVRKHVVKGRNVIAVEVRPGQGRGALLARFGFVPNGQSKRSVVSDAAWESTAQAPPGWPKPPLLQGQWQPVRVLGALGKKGPVPDFLWDDRFSVPPGFHVEQAVRAPAGDPTFSLINMTFDDKGRPLVSREGGPPMLCTDPDAAGVLQHVRPYCKKVRNCQGMCWVNDALLLVGDGPQGTGLYRVRATPGQDEADLVELLHRFRGGMGEHGPHAILHGPDNWLYVVIGNHAWAHIGPDAARNSPNPDRLAANSPLRRWPTGGMGPDQGRPDTTEDVLLPRLNDSRGHAANILAPGGTIWRMDPRGKELSLVAAGFRNAYDAAFSPDAELFTFDSDMEWDEALPWYRAVRICHCPPGADFVWRTGAANTPDYYLDSLPPLYETGRGSPVGLDFYDHHAFPPPYQGAYFMGDWAIGVIFAVHLQRDGATYKAKVERFCTGAPMNVTDLAVGPDGALWFVMGGRGTQGGVYRIVADAQRHPADAAKVSAAQRALAVPQPLSAWGRAREAAIVQGEARGPHKGAGEHALAHALAAIALDGTATTRARTRALDFLQRHYQAGRDALLLEIAHDPDPGVRAHVIWLLGVNQVVQARNVFLAALKDGDAVVRRRACEALIRAGIEPAVNDLWPLLGESDRFVGHAARLVLERIDPRNWADRIWTEANDRTVWQAIVALCQVNKIGAYADPVFARLRGTPARENEKALLDYLRTVQLALIHASTRPASVRAIAAHCEALFPHPSWRVNRELAIVLTDAQREGLLDHPIVGKLYEALQHSEDRQQQIHYFYCLRLLKDGWTPEQRRGLASWYDATKTWRGGHSFTPFLENIFRETLQAFPVAERRQLLEKALVQPLPALVLATRLQVDRQPELFGALRGLVDSLPKAGKGVFRGPELHQAALDALLKTVTAHPTPEGRPYLFLGLESHNPVVRLESLRALTRVPGPRPKADEPAPFRAVLRAAAQLPRKDRWDAVELLRRWTDRNFGAARGKADDELGQFARWFAQTFPKEPPLPLAGPDRPASPSKYKMAELLKLLDDSAKGGKGNVERGRLVFAKASCAKCHKHGKEGEGVGPDLTSLAKRFKRTDILESILEPSKVISDQYRSTTIVTTSGQQITGLAAAQGDTVTVVLSDASKVTLNRDEIDSQFASLISVMPEQLLDPLTPQEIIDLFAFLESEPKGS